jgi:hypothetical protein
MDNYQDVGAKQELPRAEQHSARVRGCNIQSLWSLDIRLR